jgi:hypothetical protein
VFRECLKSQIWVKNWSKKTHSPIRRPWPLNARRASTRRRVLCRATRRPPRQPCHGPAQPVRPLACRVHAAYVAHLIAPPYHDAGRCCRATWRPLITARLCTAITPPRLYLHPGVIPFVSLSLFLPSSSSGRTGRAEQSFRSPAKFASLPPSSLNRLHPHPPHPLR